MQIDLCLKRVNKPDEKISQCGNNTTFIAYSYRIRCITQFLMTRSSLLRPIMFFQQLWRNKDMRCWLKAQLKIVKARVEALS